MSEYKILIIDDETLARQKVVRFLRETAVKFSAPLKIDEATNGLEGLEKISSFWPDLIILDIQMPGMTGMEMLQQLEKRPFKIIFATAYEQFALKAFDENACDYLLKPFDLGRFERALEKAIAGPTGEKNVNKLQATFKKACNAPLKITYRVGDRIKILNLVEISHFESREHFTYAHTPEGEKLIDMSLGFLEEQLDGHDFTRIHRHVIVSNSHIREVKKGEAMSVVLKNAANLAVSRNNQKKILALILRK